MPGYSAKVVKETHICEGDSSHLERDIFLFCMGHLLIWVSTFLKNAYRIF